MLANNDGFSCFRVRVYFPLCFKDLGKVLGSHKISRFGITDEFSFFHADDAIEVSGRPI